MNQVEVQHSNIEKETSSISPKLESKSTVIPNQRKSIRITKPKQLNLYTGTVFVHSMKQYKLFNSPYSTPNKKKIKTTQQVINIKTKNLNIQGLPTRIRNNIKPGISKTTRILRSRRK